MDKFGLPGIVTRMIAALKAIRAYKRSKFSRYGGSAQMFGQYFG